MAVGFLFSLANSVGVVSNLTAMLLRESFSITWGSGGGGGGGVSLLHSRVCISSHHIRESVVRLLLGVIGCLVAGIAMF